MSDGSDPVPASAEAAARAAAQAAAEAERIAVEARERAERLAAAAAQAEQAADAATASADRAADQVVTADEVAAGAVVEPAEVAPADVAPADVAQADVAPADVAQAELSELARTVRDGYAFDGPALSIGALVEGEAVPEAQVRIPLGMLNRHGLVAGATGTGKTKTLQGLAEQIAAAGVPVFAADIKRDLSGLAVAGTPSDKLTARCESIGQNWTPVATPTEFFALGGLGTGVPVRATVESFGPVLLSKVLGLNDTQESSLSLVFHYARTTNRDLIDLADLRAVLTWLTGDGKPELKELGGLSTATVGVILRELIAFADQGAEAFFGLPGIEVTDFLRTQGEFGIVSMLEVPGVHNQPALFSTFLMYLLTQLFEKLPEVGDIDKPKLVFFFDEAHLLFKDASKDFLEVIAQTVRLIRSKGVGIFFVTQTPRDVPSEVLAQLGSRIQHQLRAHTPDDAKALKSTVKTYPTSTYDLEEVLTQLAIGEAIVTVMNEKGAPSPVAWTRLRAPQGSMEPMPAADMKSVVDASPLQVKYGTAVNPPSAQEQLAAEQGAREAEAQTAAEAEKSRKAAQDREADRAGSATRPSSRRSPSARRTSNRDSTTEKIAKEAARTLAREVVKNLFKRRR